MPNEGALPPLLSRRLLLVTGKGGTGKTTVAARIARTAAPRQASCCSPTRREAQLPRCWRRRAAAGYRRARSRRVFADP